MNLQQARQTRIARIGALGVALLVVAGLEFANGEDKTKSASSARAAGPVPAIKFDRVPNGGIQPQVLTDAQGRVHLVYFSGTPGAGNVSYVRRDAGKGGFSKPIQVNSQPESSIATGSIRGAQFAIGKGDRVHVAWNGSDKAEPKGDVMYGNPMLYTRLDDTGRQFEPQRNVIYEAFGLDGGGSVAADRDGNVYVVWHAGGSEVGRRVWVARSSDDGATFAEEAAADPGKNGACGCCGLKAWAGSDGALLVLYRSARESKNRDMQLLLSTDQGKSFRNELVDRWMVASCPMSSEAFAESPEAFLAAWEMDGQVLFSRIEKQTQVRDQPIAPAGGKKGRKHPALAINARGDILLCWSEGTGWERGGALAWQVFDKSGKPTKERGRKDGIPMWSFPAVYAEPSGDFVIVY